MFVIAALHVYVVAAQSIVGGSIGGYIRDEQGGVLPGVLVSALSADPPDRRLATTDRAGYFRITDLSPGEYSVAAERDGFAKIVRSPIVVREGLSLSVDLTMMVGSLSDVITVTAETPMLEWKTAVQAVNISGDLQRELPLSSLHTWSDFLLLTPGIVSTQARFQTYGLHGTTHPSGAFLVDGADVTSVLQGSTVFAQFAADTFSDVQVKTGAVDAASPLGLGPIVNIATRTGTNEIRGSADLTAQPKAWNSSNTPGGQDLTVHVAQVDVGLGGPIVRDRWWFFGSLRVARNATGVARSLQQTAFLAAIEPGFAPFDNDWAGQFGFVKLTGRISPKHQLLLSYNRDVVRLGGAQANEAALFRETVLGGPMYFGRVSSVWNTAMTTRVAVGYNGKRQQNRTLQPNTTGIAVHESVFTAGGRLLGTGVIAARAASPFAGVDFDVDMWTLTGDATWFTPSRLGSHELSAGIYLQPRRRNRWITRYNNGGFQLEEVVLRDPRNPSAGVVPFRRVIYDVPEVTSLAVDGRDTAVYVQDAWQLTPRVTVTGGVRIDAIRRVDRNFDAVTQDSVEVGPRVGVTYMLSSDLRQSLRASWSRVHENMTQNETQAGTNLAGLRELYDPAFDGSFSTVFATPPRTSLASNLTIDLDRYHQQYVAELIVGYRHQLPGQVAVDVSTMRRAYRDRPAAVAINGIYEGAVFAGYRDETQNEIYRLTPNRWNWPVSTSVQIEVSKSTSRLRLIAGYVREYSHLAGTWQPNDPASFIQPDAFRHAGGIGFVNGCTSGPACPDANSLTAGFGGGTWRNHVANGGLTVNAPWGIHLATTYNFQTGPWSGPIQTLIPAPDPRFGPPTVTLSNGRVVSNPLATTIRFAYATRADEQFRLAPLHIWNIKLARTVSLGARRLETALSVLNVTNHGADQILQPGANQQFSPFFHVGTSRQFPRAFQLSIRIVF
ncbi:MAG TPA: TonB-dependent receptor [Vicinamibacterales bacterium]|nr:TonB-dependent receptor [Vicinamibacterales bacterium]